MVKAYMDVIYRCRKCKQQLGQMHPKCGGGVRFLFENQFGKTHTHDTEIDLFSEVRIIEIKCRKCDTMNNIII